MKRIVRGLRTTFERWRSRGDRRGHCERRARSIDTVEELRALLAETVAERETLTLSGDRLPARFVGHLMADLGRIASEADIDYTAEFTDAGIRLAPRESTGEVGEDR